MIPTLDIADLAPIHDAAHDAALIVRVRNATIAECQRWLVQASESMTQFARNPELRESMLRGSQFYRSAAVALEALKSS